MIYNIFFRALPRRLFLEKKEEKKNSAENGIFGR